VKERAKLTLHVIATTILIIMIFRCSFGFVNNIIITTNRELDSPLFP